VDQIDRDLAALLSVEPSPEFRARVRARIAAEPAPRFWSLRWPAAAAAAMAVALVVGFVVGLPRVADNVRAPGPIAVDQSSHPASAVAQSRSVVAQPSPAPVVRPRTPRVNGVEVLVAADEVRALRQLAAIVQQNRARFVFAAEGESVVVQEPVLDLVVAPIAVAPIEVAATNSEPAVNSEGDEQ